MTDIQTKHLEIIQDGCDKRRIRRLSDGVVLGWIRKWYATDAVNKTGIKMFRAEPAGHANSGQSFDSFQSALGFLEHYWT